MSFHASSDTQAGVTDMCCQALLVYGHWRSDSHSHAMRLALIYTCISRAYVFMELKENLYMATINPQLKHR